MEQGHHAHIYVISQAPPLQRCQLNEGCEEFYSASVSGLVVPVQFKRPAQSGIYISTLTEAGLCALFVEVLFVYLSCHFWRFSKNYMQFCADVLLLLL